MLRERQADLTFVLDRIFEGVCRPFKVRVEQVLQSQSHLIISYKLSSTLEFYSYSISDLLGRETALCNALWVLKDAAQKTFFDILKTRGEKLLRHPPLVSVGGYFGTWDGNENAVNYWARYAICELAGEAHKSKGTIQLSRSRTTSDPGQLSKSSVDSILSNSSSTHVSQTSETSSKNFLIICLCTIQQPLLGHDIASEYAKKLGTMIDSHIHGLVQKEVDAILRRCGLSDKISYFHNSLHSEEAGEPLSEIEGTSPSALSEFLKVFFGLILRSESSLPEFEQMQVPRLQSEAFLEVGRSLTEAYELIYKGIMDPKNKYPRSEVTGKASCHTQD